MSLDYHLNTSAHGKFFMGGGPNAAPGAAFTYYYMLRDEEPTGNIYFAIGPGKNNNQRP